MPIRLTSAVKALLIACFVVFIVQQTADQYFGANLLGGLGLVPAGIILEYRFWQLFTYPFLHGDVMHLFLNLMLLVFIGVDLEMLWGTRRFLKYYFFCSTCAGIVYLLIQTLAWKGQNLFVPMVGASGAIYGLLLAYGLLFGERVFLFMLFFPMKAKHFVWILALVELMTTLFSGRAGGGLASAAHLAGMGGGFVYLWVRALWQISQRRRVERGSQGGSGLFSASQPKKNPGHLKLIIDNEKKTSSGRWEDSDPGPKTWH